MSRNQLILAIGAVVIAMVIANVLWRNISQTTQTQTNAITEAAQKLTGCKDVPTRTATESPYENRRSSVDELLKGLQQGVTAASITFDDVLSGGVPKDGIPPIDTPCVSDVSSAPEWLNPDGDGLLVERDGKARFYPYQVLVSHEIVNDSFAGEDLLVTYCPLCFTGVVFDPTLDGVPVEFGVSGKLWESNLLMYNRSDPESLWSQALGEAVVGELTGQTLPIVRFDITTYGKYAATHPDGEVVIGDAQDRFPRSYARTPYGGDLRNIPPIFPFSGEDDRLQVNDIVLGLLIGDSPKAYHVSALERDVTVTDAIGGEQIEIEYDSASGVAAFYRVTSEGRERLSPVPSFWISWVSVHPDTDVYK